ncbi:MAG: transglutaminaseTgpA domain-containing protein, partial [Actinomycetota bacterium]
MRRAGFPLLVTGLALVCAVAIAAQLRRMLEPAGAWPGIAVAIVACLVLAWLVRLAPAGLPRISATAVALLAAVLGVVGLRTGRWPLQEDVGGPDGYLGSAGYLRETGLALGEIARAWVQVLYPADAAAEPDAVAVVRLVGLVLVLAAAIALIAYRSPVPAVLAVAAATAVGSLFLGLGPVWAYGLGLAVLGIALLALVGSEARGRAPAAVLWSGGLLGVAALLALAGPFAVGSGAWAWQDWTIEEPDPVTVGFVWDQSLGALDFAGEEVTVLEVAGRDIGYLRVGVLEGFDGVRWRSAGSAVRAVEGSDFPLPDEAVPQLARTGERAVREVEIRNVALQTEELPLPGGTVAVRGLTDVARPVGVSPEGVVRLRSPLPVGAVYAAETVRVPVTPELLDRDVLGALTDPTAALVAEFAEDPIVGRNADEDAAAPWSDGADERADQEQPGPYGQDALDASRPPRTDGLLDAPLPPAAQVSVAGVAFPAFGAPGREAEVERILADEIARGGVDAGAFGGWRSAYRLTRPVVQAAQTPYQAAVLLEDWFQREFEYDETASYASGSPGGPLPGFILSSARRGHCQYFAGAMATLLRMHGVPARVAVGFTQGTEDGDRRIITNRDAHAWVEVRFPYAGWV